MHDCELLRQLGRRRIILDYHFSDYPDNALTRVDAAHIVESAKQANAASLLMYTKDHWGNMYTNTTRYKRHKNVPGDLFGEVLLEAQKQGGLQVFAYYSVGWDEYYARLYPEWLARDSEGNVKTTRNNVARWSTLCINSPYRNTVFAQISEIVASYDVPALFLDILLYHFGDVAAPCHCNYCQALWKADTGRNMPAAFNFTDKMAYLKLRDRFYTKFLQDIRNVIAKQGKQVALVHNFGVDFRFDDYMSKEAEPWGHDYYSGSMAGKIFRSYAMGKSTEIITARFNKPWDFTIKSHTQLIWEAVTAAANHAAFMIIDQPNIDGTVEPASTTAMKAAFDAIATLEPVVAGTRPYAEIALMFSYKNQEIIHEKLHYTQFEEEFYGAYKMLSELHMPFDVITDQALTAEALRGKRILIVPNIICISEEHVAVIRAFVESGGSLVFTYKSATRDMNGAGLGDNRSFGIVEQMMETPSRFQFCRSLTGMSMPYMRINNGAVHARFAAGFAETAAAQLVLPALECEGDKWVSHNIQPGEPDQYPGVAIGRVGSGEVVYFAFKFFTEYLEQGLADYRRGFAHLLARRYKPEVSVIAHPNVEASYMEKDGVMTIVLTNCTVTRPAGSYRNGLGSFHTNFDEVMPAVDIRIVCRTEPQQAESLFQGALDIRKVEADEVRWEISLPRLELYDAVSFRL